MMQEEFREIGYSIDYRLVNTADYGIPQRRERIIIFGVPNDSSELIENSLTLYSLKRATHFC
ncbi:DNA-cytosine methyltransferase [Streptococcus agalactiae]|nr:DNA-cytosine methyltransferase [Streptococcus agalactiae]